MCAVVTSTVSFRMPTQGDCHERSICQPGYWIEWGGAFENQQRALARLSLIVPLTILFIFLLLYTAFNSIEVRGA